MNEQEKEQAFMQEIAQLIVFLKSIEEKSSKNLRLHKYTWALYRCINLLVTCKSEEEVMQAQHQMGNIVQDIEKCTYTRVHAWVEKFIDRTWLNIKW